MIIIFLTLLTSFISAQSLVDFENFENYEITTLSNEYNSMTDEIDTDGITENIFAAIGSLTTGNMSKQILIRNPPSANVNEFEIPIVSVVGNPENQNFIYNVTICQTSVASLNGSFNYEQCDTTPIVLNEYFHISDYWGASTGIKTIPFNENFLMVSATRYIIDIRHVSGGVSANHFWTPPSDGNAPVNNHAVRFTGSSPLAIAHMYNVTLRTADWDMDNLRAESLEKWQCGTGFGITSCNKNIGAGTGTSNLNLATESGNQFLRSIATNGVAFNYKQVSALWNHTDITTGVDAFTIVYDIRMNSYSDTIACGGEKKRGYAGLTLPITNSLRYDTSDTAVSYLGNLNECTDESNNRLRGRQDSFDQTVPLVNASCDVNDGNFHTVIQQFNYNSTPALESVVMYVDGVNCQNYTAENSPSFVTSPLTQFNIDSQAEYSIDIDNLAVYDGLIFASDLIAPALQDVITCPIDNCIFYDDFEDNDVSDWSDFVGSTQVIDGVLYWDLDVSGFRFISNDFLDYDRDLVTGIVEFFVNDTITPNDLDVEETNNFMGYTITTQCDELSNVYTYQVIITRDDDFTLSENRSLFNVFVSSDGDLRNLGVLTVNNGENIIVKNDFNRLTQQVGLNFITAQDFDLNQVPDIDFIQNYDVQCNQLKRIKLDRFGFADADTFVGFDRIFYYTQEGLTPDDEFIYRNESDRVLRNESIIPDDLDEKLHSGAETLGFRSTGMKMLFWIFLFVIFIYWIIEQLNINSSGMKTAIVGTLGLIMIVIGWYIKFIPTIVFAFLLFVVAIMGALVFQRIFTGSNPSG